MNKNFTTSAHAKCILAGEHAVLRGCPAIILPIKEKRIQLSYESALPLKFVNLSSHGFDATRLFYETLNHALELQQIKIKEEEGGTFYLENNIEVGAGIGFSSALCVAVSRWLIGKTWLDEKDLFQFSRRLEDIYHGKSSGMDVAGAMSDGIISFLMSGEMYEIHPRWKPKLYLSYSGIKKNTQVATSKVRELGLSNPQLSSAIDSRMKESVLLVEEALVSKDGLDKLVLAFDKALGCFSDWGLITPHLDDHLNKLRTLGALAVKPTGAGMGGHAISLWERDPPKGCGLELISY